MVTFVFEHVNRQEQAIDMELEGQRLRKEARVEVCRNCLVNIWYLNIHSTMSTNEIKFYISLLLLFKQSWRD